MEWSEYKDKFTEKAKQSGYTERYIEKNLAYAEIIANKGYPIIYDVAHFSKLVGVSYEYIYKVSNASKYFYRKFDVKKKNGKKRVIHEPLPLLKSLQMWILRNILEKKEVSIYAKAYKKRVSLKENVRFHRGQKIVLKLDILNFFSSIESRYVYDFFRSIGYNKSVSRVLTNLCTLNRGLPQGASTSPYLSNIVMYNLDRKISNYCKKKKIRYTRYADDMTFSGDFKPAGIIHFVKKELSKLNLELNYEKTKILGQNDRQNVTGVVVNQKIQIDRITRNNLRLEIYFLKKNQENHLRNICEAGQESKYLMGLLGRVNYGLHINEKDTVLLKYKEIIYEALSHYRT